MGEYYEQTWKKYFPWWVSSCFSVENCDRSTPTARSIPVRAGNVYRISVLGFWHHCPWHRTRGLGGEPSGYHWDGKNLVFTDYGYHSLGQKQSKNHRDNINIGQPTLGKGKGEPFTFPSRDEKTWKNNIPYYSANWPHCLSAALHSLWPSALPFWISWKADLSECAWCTREMCSWLTANPEISVLSQLDWESM